MFIRQAARRVVVGVAAVSAASAFSIAMLAGPAGAAAPTEGSIVPNSLVPQSGFNAGAPFDSGQQIDVVVPANSVFTNPNQNVNILECAAPNGVPPTSSAQCDGNTINGNTMTPNADGSLDYEASSGSLYTVYALPDKPSLGEGPTSQPVCGTTPATECILYIGVNQLDFTQPHVWSQPFFIQSDATDSGSPGGDGSQPPAQTPEVPFAIILPIAAMGLIGGTVVIRRRRLGRVASDA